MDKFDFDCCIQLEWTKLHIYSCMQKIFIQHFFHSTFRNCHPTKSEIDCVITSILSVLLAQQNLREFPLQHYNHQMLLRGSLFPEPQLSSSWSSNLFLSFISTQCQCHAFSGRSTLPQHSFSIPIAFTFHLHSVADNFLIHARGWIHEKFLKVACSGVLTHHDW